jgi:hypothetical protein
MAKRTTGTSSAKRQTPRRSRIRVESILLSYSRRRQDTESGIVLALNSRRDIRTLVKDLRRLRRVPVLIWHTRQRYVIDAANQMRVICDNQFAGDMDATISSYLSSSSTYQLDVIAMMTLAAQARSDKDALTECDRIVRKTSAWYVAWNRQQMIQGAKAALNPTPP